MEHQYHLFSSASYPALAYVTAFLGSVLGLACASRYRSFGLRQGWNWLGAGALVLGSGIWGMHFIAMLGFSVDRVELRYDLPLTALSLFVAVAVVGAGMLIAGVKRSWPALIAGGLVSGLGVAAMHYLGMAALRFPGTISYDGSIVLLSIVIAVVAATAALWATLRVTGGPAMTGAAVIMGFAISGMHYTGMLAVEVKVDRVSESGGTSGFSLIMPLIIGLASQIFVIGFALLMSPEYESVKVSLGSGGHRLQPDTGPDSLATAAPAPAAQPGLFVADRGEDPLR